MPLLIPIVVGYVSITLMWNPMDVGLYYGDNNYLEFLIDGPSHLKFSFPISMTALVIGVAISARLYTDDQ